MAPSAVRRTRVLLSLALSVALACTWLALAPQAQAATSYYVSTSGNDSNAGTLAAPWRTLGKAAEVAGPSDTVYVRAGTYSGGVWLGRTGSDSAWITFRNYPGERPVLQGGSTGTEAVGIGGQYYEINGFEIAGPSRAGISVWGGKHIRLRNNVIHGTYWGGIFTGNGASDVTADGNTVYDTVLINRNEAGNWREAIAIGGDDNRAINNYVYENYGEGIGVYGNRAYAAGNVVRDSYGANIYVNNVRNATVERNFTYTTYASAFYRTLYGVRGPAMGIQFANELTPAEDPNQLDNLKVLNNIFLGGIYAMHYWNGMGGGGIKNSVIAGNTFVEGSKEVNSVLNIQSDAGHTNTVIADNIFTSTDGSGIADWEVAPSLAGLSFSHNLWNVGTKPSRLSGTGDVIADPKLVKPHGTTAADYKLQAGSPAIDKGRAVPGLTEDFFRTTRPKGAAPDIGAHEHTAATTPTPTPTPTPTATPTPTPTATPTATPTPTPTPSGSCKVTYTVTQDWWIDGVSRGFNADIWMTNTGSTAIDGWRLSWTYPGTTKVTGFWLGTWSQSGQQVTLTSASWNARIAAGAAYKVNIQGTYTGTNTTPTGFTVNGAPCG